MAERTITAQTASKTFNMFGWRIGWIVAPPEISARIQMICSHSSTCVTSFAQAGAAAALDGNVVQGTLTLAELVANYQVQRDALVNGLRAIRGVSCTMPRGAYFVFPDIRRLKRGSEVLSAELFANARIAWISGSVFGKRRRGVSSLCVQRTAARDRGRGAALADLSASALSRMNYQFNWAMLTTEPYFGWILDGVLTTLHLALIAWCIAFVLGVTVGVCRVSTSPALRLFGGAHVELFHNIPLLVQLFLWLYVAPQLLPADTRLWWNWLDSGTRHPVLYLLAPCRADPFGDERHPAA